MNGGGWNKGMVMASLVVAAAAAVMAAAGEAQVDTNCAQQLAPCLDFVDSANPSLVCCNPIQNMVINDLSCLCSVYSDTDFLQSLGLNRTIALRLIRRCGLTVSFASCEASVPPPTEATLPQATPGADGGDAGRVSCTTGLAFLLLLGAAMLFHF
ncbi:non-specific lipid transfer protein GPI-anchored 7-like [Prosopis cineraria]|uniref:non-specific lipid transfer protein GPI-anchored 7-like n=1 Tax=Prosopis cineraria TaxID=364024 RepID=UPI0024102F60|nr:non-specific lipid transfer protein GPI-anchored 7-like [Prosopis cineraria]